MGMERRTVWIGPLFVLIRAQETLANTVQIILFCQASPPGYRFEIVFDFRKQCPQVGVVKFTKRLKLPHLLWCHIDFAIHVVSRTRIISHDRLMTNAKRLKELSQGTVLLNPFAINNGLIDGEIQFPLFAVGG